MNVARIAPVATPPADPIPTVFADAARLVDTAAAAYVRGAELVEHVPLDGDDWYDRYSAALHDVGEPWTRGQEALADARTAVALLDRTDTRVAAALARLDQAAAFIQRGYSYVADQLRTLPQPLEPHYAGIALGRIGGAGRTIASGLTDAAAAIRTLAATGIG